MLEQIDLRSGKFSAISAHRLVFITSKSGTKEKQFSFVFEMGSACEVVNIIFQISSTVCCTVHGIIKGQEWIIDTV